MLPAKPKCILIVTALAKVLLKMSALLRRAMVLHFIPLGSVRIGDFWRLLETFFTFQAGNGSNFKGEFEIFSCSAPHILTTGLFNHTTSG
jgi:hypothetical protein